MERRLTRWPLRMASGIDAAHQWILDSGSSRHLVTTASQLYDTEEYDEECLLPNGESLRTQLKGKTRFTVRVDGEERRIESIDVYYSANLPWNVISYEKIEGR
ncbi:unnamed protein product [Peronospora destructor]|uniref:Retrovirus-related Pol polyprotein from transposon TNT 1-94-like beta-barrel domain-containing protein n=1 Tax=Peronospora destructor TaxID=86335 RepID=A0AAV0V549_9STRA|nr:unnamed protein product [Peronospora destructor]